MGEEDLCGQRHEIPRKGGVIWRIIPYRQRLLVMPVVIKKLLVKRRRPLTTPQKKCKMFQRPLPSLLILRKKLPEKV